MTLKQQGGTCITLIDKYGQYVTEMGKDETSLGRWTWIRIKGNNGLSIRIITAYIPCRARKLNLLSTYVKQTRYWRLKGESQYARIKARKDLLKFVYTAKAAGDRVILMLDGNEIMLQGKLTQLLRGDEYGMKDVIQDRVGNKKFPTWFRVQE